MARARFVRKTPEPAVDKEMSDLGSARKVRFGLASKFTAPVALMLALSIILMGVVVYHSTSASLETQLNEQGVFAARIAAAPEIDSWDTDYNTTADLQHRLTRIAAALALASGELSGNDSPGFTPTELAEVKKKIEAHDRMQEAYNRLRLQRILESAGGDSGIYLDLWILNEKGEYKVTASGKAAQYEPGQPLQLASSPETRIYPGTYRTRSGEATPARFFEHPIKDKGGATVGKAVVIFSERGIRADLRSLAASIMLFCALGILATAGVAFMTAKVITRPLGFLMRDIKAVAGGDLEHRTPARSEDEIGALAVAFDHMTRNLAAAEVMRVDLADKEHQVSLAHEVQERLFPKELPQTPGLALDAKNRLAGDLSADLFEALLLAGDKVGILVMTASGRGVPAAIVLSMARALYRSRGMDKGSPAEALKAINQLLSPDLRRGMYVSALYAILDPKAGQGVLASAGHRVPALQYVSGSGGLRKLQADGIAMGLDKGPVFDRSLTETRFTLASGDRLVLATEGAFLLQDAEGNALGEEAFMRVVLAACKKGASADAILSTLATRLGARPGDHDVTLVMASKS